MVEITVLELSFPDARLSGEAEFNAPFAGRRSSAEESDDATEPDSPTRPTAASVVALLVGLATVAALVWLRGRTGGSVDEEPDD